MRQKTFVFLLLLNLIIACTPQEEPRFVEIEDRPAASNVTFVTPTQVPTNVPTAEIVTPSDTPSPTPPPTRTPTPTISPELQCSAVMENLYTSASNLCLAGPSGYFCNGGLPPETEPQGPIANALSVQGSLVDALQIESVHSAPLATNNSGGILWLRLEDEIKMDALLVGDVKISDVTPSDAEFAKWQSFTVESATHDSVCSSIQSTGAVIIQGLYGEATRLVVNGVSVDLNGTVVVMTQDTQTKFIAIEGQVRLIVFGQTSLLNAGQQMTLNYHSADWTSPAGLPGNPQVLEYDLIKYLPSVLFDRPVDIPQPGFVETEGRVNMRSEPDINGRLLYQVPEGEIMTVLGISTDREWYHIRLGNGETGWMNADLLARSVGIIQNVYDATPAPPQRYGELASVARVIVNQGGNLREAPDTFFGVKDTIAYGTQVDLLARSPYSPWVKISSNGEIGWMALITLETESVISSLPIDYDAPLPPRPTAIPSFGFGGGHAYPDPNGGY